MCGVGARALLIYEDSIDCVVEGYVVVYDLSAGERMIGVEWRRTLPELGNLGRQGVILQFGGSIELG